MSSAFQGQMVVEAKNGLSFQSPNEDLYLTLSLV